MQYAWLTLSLFLLLPWAAIFFLAKKRREKRTMLLVSLATALLGFTEVIFVPAYWNPPSLFDLAVRTGFDVESFIFSFAIGGIVVALYNKIFHASEEKILLPEHHSRRHRFHLVAIISTAVVFVVLFLLTSLNPLHSAIIAMFVGGIATLYCRPDLKNKMLMSALMFLVIYFVSFLMLIVLFPGYVEQVWNLKAISGVLILGIPLEELLFALSFGFIWSSIYEHITWRRLSQ